MTGDEIIDKLNTVLKTNALQIEAIATRAGEKGAREAITDLMPQVEKTTKKIVEDARNNLVMALTGEEWETRNKVKDAIQWSIHTSSQAGNIGKGFLIALGGAAGGAFFALFFYAPK